MQSIGNLQKQLNENWTAKNSLSQSIFRQLCLFERSSPFKEVNVGWDLERFSLKAISSQPKKVPPITQEALLHCCKRNCTTFRSNIRPKIKCVRIKEDAIDN